jgi:hypothetical protein
VQSPPQSPGFVAADEDEVCKDMDKMGKINELGIYIHDESVVTNPAFEDFQPRE